MSKKIILLLASILSVSAFAHTVEFGFENEQYESRYNTSDIFMPYVSATINPSKESNLKIDLKYMYQDQYGKERAEGRNNRFKTQRDRFEMFASGYSYKNGDFAFTPKVGFRYEQWSINDNSLNHQTKRNLSLRFFPDMNYKLTNTTSLYLSGFTGPLFTETKQESRKDSGYKKGNLDTNYYYGDWYQEVQLIGIKQALPNKDSIWASLYNEYKYLEHSSEYMRWQLRGGYNWGVTSKLAINPFIRYDIYHEEKGKESASISGSNHGKTRDKDETRVGTTFSYKFDPTLTLVGEVYWQTAKNIAYNGKASPDRDRMFYKLGLRKAF